MAAPRLRRTPLIPLIPVSRTPETKTIPVRAVATQMAFLAVSFSLRMNMEAMMVNTGAM